MPQDTPARYAIIKLLMIHGRQVTGRAFATATRPSGGFQLERVAGLNQNEWRFSLEYAAAFGQLGNGQLFPELLLIIENQCFKTCPSTQFHVSPFHVRIARFF
ncbi:hypothetical protein [Thiobacillus sp.]|uniref:hypothetical protein n=1 Tax=Thiobacillus sp. TaxID=924 RepID=UPI0025D77137|nr:hypothetical protein [Thiobacillus sp.]